MDRRFMRTFQQQRLLYVTNPDIDGGAGTTPVPATPADDDVPGDQEPLREPGLKALRAERARAEKAEQELAALKKAQADAAKTETQRQADALAEAQAHAAAAEARSLRYEIAAELGLSLKLAARLQGATREELVADAEQFQADLAGTKPADDAGETPAPKTMKPNLNMGGNQGTIDTDGYSAGLALFNKLHGKDK